ncbi:hypothetical protein HK102_012515, partial [Quaeritorhiza haematococci]
MELRRSIGEGLVEEIEDLRREVELLIDIQASYRRETEQLYGQIPSIASTFQRSALQQKIKLLLENYLTNSEENSDTLAEEGQKNPIVDYIMIKNTMERSRSTTYPYPVSEPQA